VKARYSRPETCAGHHGWICRQGFRLGSLKLQSAGSPGIDTVIEDLFGEDWRACEGGSGWSVAFSAVVLERVGQELGQRDGPGQRCAVEVAGFAPAQQLFAVGVPREAMLALEELGEDRAGLGWIAGGEPLQRFR
jgi:hypothetical protein